MSTPDQRRRLAAAARRIAIAHRRRRRMVDLAPASAYEVQNRQMLEHLSSELGELRNRLNGLLFLLAGAIAADILLRLVRP